MLGGPQINNIFSVLCRPAGEAQASPSAPSARADRQGGGPGHTGVITVSVYCIQTLFIVQGNTARASPQRRISSPQHRLSSARPSRSCRRALRRAPCAAGSVRRRARPGARSILRRRR
jgi:hypothetical protein